VEKFQQSFFEISKNGWEVERTFPACSYTLFTLPGTSCDMKLDWEMTHALIAIPKQ
jgi:hypothetical protein